MRSARISRSCLLLLSLLAGCASTGPENPDGLAVKDAGDRIELTVPVSRLIVSVPKGGFSVMGNRHGGATESPRYFYMEDAATGAAISGWFEPAKRYVPLENALEAETKGLIRHGFGAPENIVAAELGHWRTILYGIPMPSGSSSHIRASYVAAGTWIDLHASVSSSRSSADTRAQVVALLQAIEVREKP